MNDERAVGIEGSWDGKREVCPWNEVEMADAKDDENNAWPLKWNKVGNQLLTNWLTWWLEMLMPWVSWAIEGRDTPWRWGIWGQSVTLDWRVVHDVEGPWVGGGWEAGKRRRKRRGQTVEWCYKETKGRCWVHRKGFQRMGSWQVKKKTQRSPDNANSGMMLQGDTQRYESMILSCTGKDFRSMGSCKAWRNNVARRHP